MNAPIFTFCKHCEKANIHPRTYNVKKCAKQNRLILCTIKKCDDYEKSDK